MAITVSQLTGGQDSTDATSYVTASIAPTANKLILVTVLSEAGTASAPTITGASMTWTQVDTQAQSGRRITVFRGLSASPGSGALTIDFGANTQDNIMWTVEEFTGIDTSGTNGSGAIVQVTKNTVSGGTSLTVTLAAFSSVNNATYGAFCISQSTSSTVGSGFAKVGDQGVGNNRMTTEFKGTNDTSVDITWADTAVDTSGAIAIEIKAADATTTSTTTTTSTSTTTTTSTSTSTSTSTTTTSTSTSTTTTSTSTTTTSTSTTTTSTSTTTTSTSSSTTTSTSSSTTTTSTSTTTTYPYHFEIDQGTEQI